MNNSPDDRRLDRPCLIFDGDCAVCRAIVDRWRAATGDKIRYLPYQERGVQFPHIGENDLRRAVHLIDTDRSVSRGANAVFRAAARCGRKRWLLALYQSLPPFAWAADSLYRVAAASRRPWAAIRRIWWGKDLKPPTYFIASTLFLRLLGVVYLIAFLSLWLQIDGLVGSHGILPAADFLDAIGPHFASQEPPASAVWNLPTLMWISPSDAFLHMLCAAGTLLSLMLFLGLLPIPTLILLWLLYLSLFHVGQVFLSFQWDILLLETGFIAIFLAPFTVRSKLLADRHPPRLAIWLVSWLLFRLMFESGAVKLSWNDGQLGPNGSPAANTWESLNALDYHYWSQPLPIWTSWYAAKLPSWFQKLSVLFVFTVEMGLPWLIFGPRVLRYVACGGITLLMLLIAGTGNYNFFNLLTVLLALMLLDDKIWPQFLRRRISGADWPVLFAPLRWRSFFLLPYFVLALMIGTLQLKDAVTPSIESRSPLESRWNIVQFFLVNDYGLFRRMTETRPELVIEGSANGTDWKSYDFRWKPGRLSGRPRFCTPHQPRLDWQMWFEALRWEQIHAITGTVDLRYASPWFQSFLLKLLNGNPKVVGLLADNPFPGAPPKYIRVTLYQYRFTDSAEGKETGNWWHRKVVWVGPGLSLSK